MTKIKIALCLLACVAGGVLALSQMHPAVTTDSGPDLQDMLGVPKTAMQMHLYSANRNKANGKSMSGKTFGFDYYVNGGKDKRHVHNEFEDGASEDLYMRADGTTESSREYYPTDSRDEPGVLKSRATFAKDGTTWTSHDVFNAKGVLERSGQLLGSGWYQQMYFCEDGVHSRRLRLFNDKREFLSEKVYSCDTGLLVAEVFPGTVSGQFLVTLRRPDGTRAALLTKDYSGIGGDVFAADGETVIASFRKETYSENAKYFAGKDAISQIWQNSFGTTQIIVQDPATGKKVLFQEWKDRPGDKPGEKRMLLSKIIEYVNSEPTREIELTGEGKTTVNVSVPLGKMPLSRLKLPTVDGGSAKLEGMRDKMHLVHTLDASGKVVKTVLHIDYQSWDDVVQDPSVAPAKIAVPSNLFKQPEHTALPNFDDFGPDRVYDYPATPRLPVQQDYSGYPY